MIKNRKIILLLVIILLVVNLFVLHTSYASFNITNANLYTKGEYVDLLMYDGIKIGTNFVVYAKDGKEYPAYCLDKTKPGAENGSYTVNVDSLYNNMQIWKVIINGYPYKSYQELGCNSPAEAYVATKMAVYHQLYTYDINKFVAVGQDGTRVLNALKKIVSNANASKESKVSSEITLKQDNTEWKVDSLDPKYISNTYTISSAIKIADCKVTLEGNVPESTRITDINNKDKSTFSSEEKIKILLPIKNLTKSDVMTIQIAGAVATKPLFYGKAPNASKQDYVLTATMYEDGKGSLKVYYEENNTCFRILKIDGTTQKPLAGVKFDLLDKDQNVIYKDLVTNQEGRIELKNLLPDKYFVKETKTQESYTLYDKPVQVEIGLHQLVTMTVNNNKDNTIKVTTDTQNITIGQQNTQVDVNHSSTQINQQGGNTNILVDNNNTNINSNEQNTNASVNNNNTNINTNNSNHNSSKNNSNVNINNNNTNSNQTPIKLPKTGM